MSNSNDKLLADEEPECKTISRKNFFKYAGVSAASAVAVGLYGCGDDDNDPMGPDPEPEDINLGSGDVGILNFAYALEQLEAAFYIKATAETSWMNDGDGAIFEDIRDHEIAHRDWFKAVIDSLGDGLTIPGLTPIFEDAGVDFSDRESVIGTAIALEDTGVGAYNGAGQFVSADGAAYLVQAGKIVSVEARHAAAVRDLLNPGSADFAGDLSAGGTVDENGLDHALSISTVLDNAGPFIMETLDASNVGK